MPWTDQNQRDAEQEAAGFEAELNEKWAAWANGLVAGNPGSGQAAVEDVIRRWRKSLEALKGQSDAIMSDDSVLDSLGQLANQVADEKRTLAKLRSESGTREEQSDSVNPKVRPSPYTNILGLQRTFRSSTRFSILIASIVFAVLAICAVAYLAYRVVSSGELVPMGYIAAGGARRSLI